MFVALALIAGLISVPNEHASAPPWFDQMLAGYSLSYDESHGVIAVSDPTNGFFLVRTVECDGGVLDVVLTRDRHYVSQAGFRVPSLDDGSDDSSGMQKLTVKKLPSLSTGKGVRIGDTPAVVTKILGRPSRIEATGSRDQFESRIYSWKSGNDEDGHLYEETYTFKKGKLIEITFTRLANDM